MTRTPVTVNASSRSDRKLLPMSSLKATRNWNSPWPSCSAGMFSKRAVSGSAAGPATVAVGPLVNCRRLSPLVQIAPDVAQSRPPSSVIVTSPSESGCTVISNRSRRSPTRSPRVTCPLVTVNASSRRLR